MLFLIGSGMAQEVPEKKIPTRVNEATVFLDGAQITRTKKVQVPKGTTLLKFAGLSPFINPKSIQVKADGNIMVLSVDHQLNYDEKAKQPAEIKALAENYRSLQDRIEEEKMHLSIIDEEIDLLNQNKKVAGQNKGLTVTDLRQVADYYAQKMTGLKTDRLKRNKQIIKLKQQQDTLMKKIKKIASIKVYPTGEINVKVSAKQATPADFTITYNVKNARWFPSYDIRATGVNEDLQWVYKANVSQNTQVDWDKVKLSFSSSNPDIPGEVPELIPYRLGYYVDAPVYDSQKKVVSGVVTDAETGEPLPGLNVILKGSSIGTATDFDGKYSLMVPDLGGVLEFRYLGYETREVPIRGKNEINVALKESGEQLQYVTINAMGIARDRDSVDDEGRGMDIEVESEPVTQLSGKVAGVTVRGQRTVKGSGVRVTKKKEVKKSIAIPMDRIEKQTSVNFTLKKPYTIKSNNKVSTVELTQYTIPADYEYIAVPKITPNAYLVSYIDDWEKYGLLSGEANVFMEGTAIGKTLIDTGYANDTLQVSLGVDKGIVVKRELSKEYTGKKLIGTKKTDTRQWKITVKNNKNQPVQVKLLDQVPIAATSDVEVETEELSGGKLNKETGEVEWKFRLAPGEKKEFILRYKVKYSRYRDLHVE